MSPRTLTDTGRFPGTPSGDPPRVSGPALSAQGPLQVSCACAPSIQQLLSSAFSSIRAQQRGGWAEGCLELFMELCLDYLVGFERVPVNSSQLENFKGADRWRERTPIGGVNLKLRKAWHKMMVFLGVPPGKLVSCHLIYSALTQTYIIYRLRWLNRLLLRVLSQGHGRGNLASILLQVAVV